MVIDWSFRAGDFVSAAGFFIGGLSVIFMMKSDIRALAIRLGFLEATVKEQGTKIDQFAELLTLMGRYEERMAAMRESIEDLRRGRGYIMPTPHD